VGGERRQRGPAAAGHRPRGARHPPLLGGAGEREVPGQQRQLPGRGGQTPRHSPPPDPPRHAPETHGPGPDAVPGRREGAGLPGAARTRRQVGLQRQRQHPFHPYVGTGVPLPLGLPRPRLSAQRRLLHRRRRAGPRGPRAARHRPRPPGRPVRAHPPRLRGGLDPAPGPRRARRPPRRGNGPAGARPLLLRFRRHRLPADRPAPRRPPGRRLLLRPRGGPLPGRRRPGHGLLVDHVRLRQPGPPDRRPRRRLGDVPHHPGRLLRPDGRRAGTGRPHPGAAHGDPHHGRLARRERGEDTGRLPAPVLRVRRRPLPPVLPLADRTPAPRPEEIA
jgi:hypothetical protein